VDRGDRRHRRRDAFIAGFIPAWLDKKPPGEALASGLRLAAHALGLIGARPSCNGGAQVAEKPPST